MKFISPVSGTVALHVIGDDVRPPRGGIVHDLIDFITAAYQFSVPATIPDGVPPFMIRGYHFQSGFLASGDEKLPIIQLSLIPNGDVITAVTTDAADVILDDLMGRLNEHFGYRFGTAPMHRTYLSNLVVQFENGLEGVIEALAKIEAILNEQIPRPSMPFKIKRLAFGFGDPLPLTPPATLEGVDNADFLIERRSGSPYSENRFFCSAPMRTADHLELLERIEKEFGG